MSTKIRRLFMWVILTGLLSSPAYAVDLGSLSVEIIAPRSNHPAYGEAVTSPVKYAIKLVSTGHDGTYTVTVYDSDFTNPISITSGAYTTESKLIKGSISSTDVPAGSQDKIIKVEAVANDDPNLKAVATMQFDVVL